jgi:hypothetical protein
MDFFSWDLADLRQTAASLLAAWLMSQAISWVYQWTHRGQDVSRSLVQTLVVGGIVGSMLMLAIGNSLARGLGIVGALAFIRFRTNLRNPLDMVYVFASFAAGIAAGTGNVLTGALATSLFLAVAASMRVFATKGGAREAELRVRLNWTQPVEEAVVGALKARTISFNITKRRDGQEGKETRIWYRVGLPLGDDGTALARALLTLDGVIEAQLGLEEGPGNGNDDD